MLPNQIKVFAAYFVCPKNQIAILFHQMGEDDGGAAGSMEEEFQPFFLKNDDLEGGKYLLLQQLLSLF